MIMDVDEHRAYWESRLQDGPTLETVGWLGVGAQFNAWMYKLRATLFVWRMAPMMRRNGIVAKDANVLDVGSGSGFYIDLWKRMGVKHLMGCDLTDAVVNSLRTRFQDVDFQRLNIGDASISLPARSFDVISCMDVLYHIIDDAQYEQSFKNFATLLRPQGLLVFTENCLHGSREVSAHQVSRQLSEIESILRRCNLEILARKPVFVLTNTPCDSRSALHRFLWRAFTWIASKVPFVGWIAGAVGYPIDLVLASFLREGPSTEVVICRRA